MVCFICSEALTLAYFYMNATYNIVDSFHYICALSLPRRAQEAPFQWYIPLQSQDSLWLGKKSVGICWEESVSGSFWIAKVWSLTAKREHIVQVDYKKNQENMIEHAQLTLIKTISMRKSKVRRGADRQDLENSATGFAAGFSSAVWTQTVQVQLCRPQSEC